MNEQQWARSCSPKSPPQLSKDRELWEVGGETEALRGLTCLGSSVIQVARGQVIRLKATVLANPTSRDRTQEQACETPCKLFPAPFHS